MPRRPVALQFSFRREDPMTRLLPLLPFALAACAPTAASCPPAPAPAAAPVADSTVVAKIGDQKVTLSEVDASIRNDLFEARDAALDKLVSERVLEQAAAAA